MQKINETGDNQILYPYTKVANVLDTNNNPVDFATVAYVNETLGNIEALLAEV